MTRLLSKKLTTDFLWYLGGAIVPALVGIFRLPVFTRVFTPAEYGFYSLVTITFTYLSITMYSWLSSCLWRFYNPCRDSRQLPRLYSNLGFLFLCSSFLIICVALVWMALNVNQLMMRLVLSTMVFIVTNQLAGLLLVVYRIQKKAFFYNLLYSLQALCSFGFALFLIFGRNCSIESIPAAQALIACVLLIFLIVLNRSKIRTLTFKYLSRPMLKELLRYGQVGLVSSMGIMVLASSDRYIIALFSNMESVGIYNQVYQLGQVSIYFLVTVFFNAVNPSLARIFSSPDRRTSKILTGYFSLFLVLLLPVTVYLSLFARELSMIMLGPEFQEGYTMIPFVMVSVFLYGLTLFSETRLKFMKLYRPVVASIITACAVNAGLNFIFIPVWGYKAAAITTFAAYLLLFLLIYRSDPLQYLKSLPVRVIVFKASSILGVQAAVDQIIRRILHVDLNVGWTIAEGVVFSILYVMLVLRYRSKLEYFDSGQGVE
ncbi:MAG: oligosaccharide flippase family protein [Bacteroidales bacterium]|nr:oligosaccharide flippase family protein [Bacteroidales bacterium]